MMTKSWIYAALPLVVGVALLIFAPIYWTAYRGIAFLILMVLMLIEFVVLGLLINGRPAGVFIDNRNRLSLSKLQAAAWTAVVLAGFATAAAYNIATAMYEDTSITALAITIPGDLLLAMGISATSLIATPALLTMKSQESSGTPAKTANKLQVAQQAMGGTVVANGKVATRTKAEDASWVDIVTGDEIGNAASPDLGKIQQVTITLLLLGCYVAYLYADLAGSQETIRTLPTLDQSFVWLLAISHASYLAYKAAPHSS